MEKEILTTNLTEVKRTISKYYEQLYPNKVDNLNEMDKFLKRLNLLKLTQKEIGKQKRSITCKGLS